MFKMVINLNHDLHVRFLCAATVKNFGSAMKNIPEEAGARNSC